MRRRDLLLTAAAAFAAPPAFADGAVPPLRQAARQAFIYASPMVEVAAVRGRLLALGEAGRFYGRAQLSTPASRGVTTPNNDTLAAQAFIDLSRGPARLTVPSLAGRYASLALMDMFTNNFQVLSRRTLGPIHGGRFLLVGPHSRRRGAGVIRAPTTWVWALVRVLVDGPADLADAAGMLGGFRVEASPAGAFAGGAAWDAPWADYLTVANRLLLENGELAFDEEVLGQIAPLMLPSPRFDPARFTGADADAVAAGVADARQFIRSPAPGAAAAGGWSYEAPRVGDFHQDYDARARVALGGLAALPVAEAMYLSAVSPTGGRRFDGDGPWKLSFPAGGTPPAGAFWSLTLYEAEPDGRFFLTANPIQRYSIGDRTQGLARDAGGALTIWIARADPGPARRANWLLAPAQGPFSLILRAYLPKPALINRSYVPPPVTAA